MKKNKKVIIILSILIIIIILNIAGIIFFRSKTNNTSENTTIVEKYDVIYEGGLKVNTSEEVAKSKKFNTLDIRNGLSTLIADITNNTNEATEGQTANIEILDENNNVIETIVAEILPLKPGKTTQLNVNITTDIAGAYDFRITKKYKREQIREKRTRNN